MRTIIIFSIVLFSSILFGQKILTNKEYSSSEIQTLSFAPFFENNGSPNNFMNELFFNGFSSSFQVCCQKDIEHNLVNHSGFNELCKTYLYTDLPAKGKEKINIYEGMSKTETLELKNGFKNTDVLILPSKVNQKTVTKPNGSGNITLFFSLAAFDLRSGEFIASVSDKLKKKFEERKSDKELIKEIINSSTNTLSKTLTSLNQ